MKKNGNNIRTLTCKEAEKSFNDLIDGYLKGKLKSELEHHIAHCRHCFSRTEFERKLKEKIREAATTDSSKSFKKRIAAILESN